MKHSERTNGPDTALYKNYLYLLLPGNSVSNNIFTVSLPHHMLILFQCSPSFLDPCVTPCAHIVCWFRILSALNISAKI